MMTSCSCYLRAELCEAKASECTDLAMSADWLSMAREWRRLGDDESVQVTTARLMHGPQD